METVYIWLCFLGADYQTGFTHFSHAYFISHRTSMIVKGLHLLTWINVNLGVDKVQDEITFPSPNVNKGTIDGLE